jgi:hypothetical protein
MFDFIPDTSTFLAIVSLTVVATYATVRIIFSPYDDGMSPPLPPKEFPVVDSIPVTDDGFLAYDPYPTVPEVSLYDIACPPVREFPYPSPISYYHCPNLPNASWYEDGITPPPEIPFGKEPHEILDYFIDSVSDRAWNVVLSLDIPPATTYEFVLRSWEYFFFSCLADMYPIAATLIPYGLWAAYRCTTYRRHVFRFRNPYRPS